jgi:hypothetical protein
VIAGEKKLKQMILWVGCLAMLQGSVEAGELYRWVDSSGKVHYGDAPAKDIDKDVSESNLVKFSDMAVANEDLPYETRRAKEKFPVTLYVSDNCDEPCNQGRKLLSKRGIPFTEKLLQSKNDIDEFKKLTGSDGAPTLAVGKIILKGFRAEDWQEVLDTAGYPKAAPYRAPKVAPPAAASGVAPAYPFKR